MGRRYNQRLLVVKEALGTDRPFLSLSCSIHGNPPNRSLISANGRLVSKILIFDIRCYRYSTNARTSLMNSLC